MALLAEEIVEEWLNRRGYFTIRGTKIGVDEIDLLALKFCKGVAECHHIEVQASMRPISYISRVPKSDQVNGAKATSAKHRPDEQLRRGVAEWVEKKFTKKRKIALFDQLFPSQWTSELVLNNVRSEREIGFIQDAGIIIHRLTDLISEMDSPDNIIRSAAGADFYDLVSLGSTKA
jgi:hypothetical protein